MLSDLELKLELLRLAHGDIDRAQTMYEWMYPPAALRTPEVETDTVQDRVEPLLDPQSPSITSEVRTQAEDVAADQSNEPANPEAYDPANYGALRPRDYYPPGDYYAEAQPDPADLPPPTEAEFNALEKLDAEPAEFISDLTGDPAVEPESGLHGEAVEMVSEPQTQAEGTGDRVEQENNLAQVLGAGISREAAEKEKPRRFSIWGGS